MKKNILAFAIIGAVTLSNTIQAQPIETCSDNATAHARNLFLKHYKKKDYTAAYYATYLYADSCPGLFSTQTPSSETLWLLSDYSLAASRTNNINACESISSLIDASVLQQHPRISQAIQTNLSLCSLKQTESQLDTPLNRATCALDNHFLALPDSWQNKVANHEDVLCIGPKTLTPDTTLTVIKKGTDNQTSRIPLKNIIPNDDKNRILFLGNERPMMVAKVFNTKGTLLPPAANERTEYYSLRPYQNNELTQQQIAKLNKGMVQSVTDNEYTAEQRAAFGQAVAASFTVDPSDWWGHKPLLNTTEMTDQKDFLVAQYNDRLELIYNLGNEIKKLNLLTGEKKIVYTATEAVHVFSIQERLLYITNEQGDTFELDLAMDRPSPQAVSYAPPPHKKGDIWNEPLVSMDRQSEINTNDGDLSIESPYYKSTVINNFWDNQWIISNLSWGGDTDEMYYDNTSAKACIWRVDLLSRRVERVIPIDAALVPYGFRVGNVPYVVYVDTAKKQLLLATPMK
ncbi:hypothetical protein ABT56_15895 [Photobacterium aquae]|uniref:Lipoprotein n=1 Tax=Photobacterium aquae TaxID=1195763 RepID=A0A0J1GXC5_9GAMM|nr:hypothetical protein [Photobacterium aquae]KLV04094.1 hypothetical protein ABT56_15895 [Photobacterium aquae]